MRVVKQSKVLEFINQKNQDSSYIQFMWLGQAGFLFKFNKKMLIVDPYLSDFLAKKHKNHLFPHSRLMEAPILPNQIFHLDFFFSTHAHTDHMDPETIRPIALNNPNCKFIVPSAVIKDAITRGISQEKIIPINAHQKIKLDNLISISAIPAAHESIKRNNNGEHFFLGYIFHFKDFNIYHSGDCIPYEDLDNFLKDYTIHLALFPINGRDEYRLTHGIAGNFHPNEVLDICARLKIPSLMVHHFGMFSYNTVSDEVLSNLFQSNSSVLEVIVPKIETIYQLNDED
ncbi:MAG: MBL fold metallo-hydrolase [Candidatus Thorarchaeota archaeon]